MLDTPPPDRPWRLAYLLLPQFSLMAFASASEPPRAANQLSGRPLYELTLVSPDGRPLRGAVSMVWPKMQRSARRRANHDPCSVVKATIKAGSPNRPDTRDGSQR